MSKHLTHKRWKYQLANKYLARGYSILTHREKKTHTDTSLLPMMCACDYSQCRLTKRLNHKDTLMTIIYWHRLSQLRSWLGPPKHPAIPTVYKLSYYIMPSEIPRADCCSSFPFIPCHCSFYMDRKLNGISADGHTYRIEMANFRRLTKPRDLPV